MWGLCGADDGNRTRVSGLGSERSTIELHLHFLFCLNSITQSFSICKKKDCFFKKLCYTVNIVGETGGIPVRARRREVQSYSFSSYPLVAKRGNAIETNCFEKVKEKSTVVEISNGGILFVASANERKENIL